jgi:hypothetical protein
MAEIPQPQAFPIKEFVLPLFGTIEKDTSMHITNEECK